MILFGTNAARRLSGEMVLLFGAIRAKGERYCVGRMAATLTLLSVLAIFMTVTVAFILINQQEWEMNQELNLKYVALTRSKNKLVFVR